MKGVNILRKALSDKGFVLPISIGKSCERVSDTETVLLLSGIFNKPVNSHLFVRYLHDCPQCFWRLHAGSRWEKAASVAEAARKKSCAKVGLKFVKISDDYHRNISVGLGEPELAGCSIFAEGAGKCWISSVFYPLTGKQSGWS